MAENTDHNTNEKDSVTITPPKEAYLHPTPQDLNSRENTLTVESVSAGSDMEKGLRLSVSSTRSRYSPDEVMVELSSVQLFLVMIGLGFGIFLAALDQTIVATALPRIASDFSALNQIAWVGTAYLLTATAFQPTYGKFSDIFGRKAAFIFAITTFELGSLLCGISPNMIVLVISRAIAGIGGGGLISMVMIIISDIVSLQDRGKYQGIIGAVFGIASLVGPLLGGAFTDHVNWRWCFYINLPFGFITIAIVVFLLPLPVPKGNFVSRLKRIDFLGTFVLICATVALLLPLNWGGQQYSWSSAIVISLLVVGGILFILFAYIEGYVAIEPVAPGRVFKNMTVTSSFATNFFQGMAFFSMVYYIPLYFQVVKGESATISGLELMPFIMGVVIASIGSGQTMSRVEKASKQMIALVGAAMIAVGAYTTSLLDEDSSRVEQTFYLLIPGLGVGLIMQTTLLASQAAVEYADVAVVTSLLNFFRIIGAVFGVAIIGTIFNNELEKKIEELNMNISAAAVASSSTYVSHLPEIERTASIHAYLQALQISFRVVIPLGVLAFICALGIGPNKPRRNSHHETMVVE